MNFRSPGHSYFYSRWLVTWTTPTNSGCHGGVIATVRHTRFNSTGIGKEMGTLTVRHILLNRLGLEENSVRHAPLIQMGLEVGTEVQYRPVATVI